MGTIPRHVRLTIAWLGFAVACHGQAQTFTVATTSSPVPPLAISVLAKAGIASAYKPISTCQATGNVVFGASPSNTGQVQFSIASDGTTKLITSVAGATRIATYLNASGTLTTSRLPPTKVPARTALLSKRLFLPQIELADIVNDLGSTVSVSGPSIISGRSVYTVTATGHWADMSLASDTLAPSVTYQVDSSTLEIVSRTDVIEDPRDNRTRYTRVFEYDDYKSSGALTLPYKVTESLQGQTVASTQWNTITVSF